MGKIKWVTDQEKDDQALLDSLMPTQEEISTAEFELKVLKLLMEVEVI